MNKEKVSNHQEESSLERKWPWWPLLPLYPYGQRRTCFRELIPNQIWSLDQLQGLYYVAVPIRLTVVKVSGGLMLINPLPPTGELISAISSIEKKHGSVLTIVLPTASGLEHKISLPALSRSFPKAKLWICPGQWSFPIGLPLGWLGIPGNRTKVLVNDGFPHQDCCEWFSLGPLNIGLGRFQEISCFHKPSGSLLVTDALVGIESKPPELFNQDPVPLLFHAREKGNEPLQDSYQARKKGWARLVLFSLFLRPQKLDIPSVAEVFNNAFNPNLRTPQSHFGIYPFSWKLGWDESALKLLGRDKPLIQVPPVVERLIFPRAKEVFLEWLDLIASLRGLRWLISAHYSPLTEFSSRKARNLRRDIAKRSWANGEGDFSFLNGLDENLLRAGIVPENPLEGF